MSQFSSSDKNYCSYCGAEYYAGDSFCANCGQSLQLAKDDVQYQPQSTTTSGPVQAGSVTPSTQPYGTIRCPTCESNVSYNAYSCSVCNTLIKGYGKQRMVDKASCGLVFLSLLIPLAGFILAVVRLSQGRKKEAGAYFIAAIISVGFGLLIQFLPLY